MTTSDRKRDDDHSPGSVIDGAYTSATPLVEWSSRLSAPTSLHHAGHEPPSPPFSSVEELCAALAPRNVQRRLPTAPSPGTIIHPFAPPRVVRKNQFTVRDIEEWLDSKHLTRKDLKEYFDS